MLIDYLEQAIRAGGEALEIEYRDSQEWFMAFKGSFGFGLGSLPSGEAEPLFEEMDALKKESARCCERNNLPAAFYRI